MWDIFRRQFQVGASADGVDTLAQRAGLARNRQCRPDSAYIPTGERAVRRERLHLLRDFSQSAILRHMIENSADISKGYRRDDAGWEITDAGRAFLASIERQNTVTAAVAPAPKTVVILPPKPASPPMRGTHRRSQRCGRRAAGRVRSSDVA